MHASRAIFIVLLTGTALIPFACSVTPTYVDAGAGGAPVDVHECMNDEECGEAEACFTWKCVNKQCEKRDEPSGAPCNAGKCDDDNVCTDDACGPDGMPSHKLISTISDNNICTIDTCDPRTGMVTYTSEKMALECGPCSKCDGAGKCQDICIDNGKICQNGRCVDPPPP